jgi:hypothetical protein
MPRPQDIKPTYAEIMTQLLDAATGPLPVQEFSEQILALRTVQAKKPLEAVRNQIRQEIGRSLIFQESGTILPIRMAMQGVRFRLQVDRNTVDSGKVQIDNSLSSYLPRQFLLEKVQFLDEDGQPIDFRISSAIKKETSIFGTYDHTAWYADLRSWFREQKVYPKAYLLFTILDWQNGMFQLGHEPYSKRDIALLQQRNQQLADLFYEMLENATYEDLNTFEAIPSVYARLPEKGGYPPDHWMIVLGKDDRMSVDDWSIRYSDGKQSPMENLVRDLAGESRAVPKVTFSKEQGKQVYRFKAELKHRPGLWREVEILGEQTLADLKSLLVGAFEHDWDHLGGFWRLVPRKGTTRGVVRYREVELGEVNPFGEGDGADLEIAGIGLSANDKIKFVFDFGDWIEHTLTLVSIIASQAGVKYPREIARNKPKYVYCVECEKKGKKVVAKWICLQCSGGPKSEVVLCEKCAQKHEEHYLEEILY